MRPPAPLRVACLGALLLPLLTAGCGGCALSPPGSGKDGGGLGALDDGGAPAIPGLTSLVVTPASVTLVTDGGSAPEETFVVTGRFSDGSERDVTDEVSWSLSDPSLGTVEGGRFVSAARGGSATLFARAGDVEGRAEITVRLEADFEVEAPGQPALPDDPEGVIDGAPDDEARAPTLVYPNDGVLLPPNLGLLEVHYLRGDDNELFEITFTGPALSVRVFTRCAPLAEGCVYTPAPEVWRLLADTSRGRDAVRVRVRGTDDEGSGRGASDEIALHFAAHDVDGALYYWTTTRRAIMRVDFGAREQVPEQFYPTRGGGPCYGCHALSPDGYRMSLSQDGQNNGQLTILDVRTQSELVDASDGFREQFQSWDPTSTKLAGIYGDGNPVDTHIRIRHGSTGEVLETIPIGNEVSHPSWSPAGDRIAFTLVTRHQTSQRPGRGGISYVEKDGSAWSEPIELVPPVDGKNRYTPAYSPDGTFLLYVESECPEGQIYNGDCDADADDVAKLWAIPAGGGAPIYLTAANQPGALDDDDDLANTFPRWAPFIDARFADGTGRVMWATFSSRRRYGLRDPGGDQLLWMVAIDPERVRAGEDGSFPAFALPFQDLATSNHMAQWAERFVEVEPDAGVYEPDAGGEDTCVPNGNPCDPDGTLCCDGALCLGPDDEAVCVLIGG